MGRPRYTKQDRNQGDIEEYLQELGFVTLRVSNLAGSPKSDVHYLDLFVLGLSRKQNRPVWSQWEIKISEDAPFTDAESKWLALSKFLFGEEVPVNTTCSVDDILRWYGWY